MILKSQLWLFTFSSRTTTKTEKQDEGATAVLSYIPVARHSTEGHGQGYMGREWLIARIALTAQISLTVSNPGQSMHYGRQPTYGCVPAGRAAKVSSDSPPGCPSSEQALTRASADGQRESEQAGESASGASTKRRGTASHRFKTAIIPTLDHA